MSRETATCQSRGNPTRAVSRDFVAMVEFPADFLYVVAQFLLGVSQVAQFRG